MNITKRGKLSKMGFPLFFYPCIRQTNLLLKNVGIKTTQTIYTHISDKRKEETAKKLNDFSF